MYEFIAIVLITTTGYFYLCIYFINTQKQKLKL